MERPVYKKHCPLFMTTVTHFNPKEIRDQLFTGCAGKKMEVSKRPVFMDIVNFSAKTAATKAKPLDMVVVRNARNVGTPSTPSTPSSKSSNFAPAGNKTGLTTYQEEICHIKKGTSCFKCR